MYKNEFVRYRKKGRKKAKPVYDSPGQTEIKSELHRKQTSTAGQ